MRDLVCRGRSFVNSGGVKKGFCAFDFGFDVFAFVEPEASFYFDALAGGCIGEDWICVDAGAVFVSPCATAVIEGDEDVSIFSGCFDDGYRAFEPFIVLRLAFESGYGF